MEAMLLLHQTLLCCHQHLFTVKLIQTNTVVWDEQIINVCISASCGDQSVLSFSFPKL